MDMHANTECHYSTNFRIKCEMPKHTESISIENLTHAATWHAATENTAANQIMTHISL